jgi:hypothetical protein
MRSTWTEHLLRELLPPRGRRARDLINTLRRSADALLVAFEKVQAQFIAYRDRLLDELEEIATR